MNHGRVAQTGKPLDLYYDPANIFVAGFIGSPAMNFFKAKVDKKGAATVTLSGSGLPPFDLAAAAFAAPVGAAVTIGVRPEHLSVEGPGAFKIAGAVELVERLGETSYAHVRIAEGIALIAEMRGRDAPKAGDPITLSADDRDLHLFDENGERIAIG
jgi:ABC-type sugar transport system ATPase subunit